MPAGPGGSRRRGSGNFLSVVIPVWNERPSLAPLFDELLPVLRSLPGRFEILAVDDGSSDGSRAELYRIAASHRELRVLALADHRGKSEALLAGFAEARGRLVATLDADLQDDPRDLPEMLEHASSDVLVIGIRERADSWWRRLSSRLANLARRVVLRDGILDAGCPVRVLPALLSVRGVSVVQVPITQRPRRFGSSKYGTALRLARGIAHLALMWRWARANRGRLPKAE